MTWGRHPGPAHRLHGRAHVHGRPAPSHAANRGGAYQHAKDMCSMWWASTGGGGDACPPASFTVPHPNRFSQSGPRCLTPMHCHHAGAPGLAATCLKPQLAGPPHLGTHPLPPPPTMSSGSLPSSMPRSSTRMACSIDVAAASWASSKDGPSSDCGCCCSSCGSGAGVGAGVVGAQQGAGLSARHCPAPALEGSAAAAAEHMPPQQVASSHSLAVLHVRLLPSHPSSHDSAQLLSLPCSLPLRSGVAGPRRLALRPMATSTLACSSPADSACTDSVLESRPSIANSSCERWCADVCSDACAGVRVRALGGENVWGGCDVVAGLSRWGHGVAAGLSRPGRDGFHVAGLSRPGALTSRWPVPSSAKYPHTLTVVSCPGSAAAPMHRCLASMMTATP